MGKGKDEGTKAYVIPCNLFLAKDVIMEQLLILEKLNLNDANRPRKVSDEDSIKQQPKENEDLSKQTSAEQVH